MTTYASDRERLRASTRDQCTRRLDALKSALSAGLVADDDFDAETALEKGEVPSAIDALVSLTARAQSRVYRVLLENLESMDERQRDPVFTFKMLEQQIGYHLGTYAIKLADYGLPRSAEERETTLQTMGAYGRVLEMMRDVSSRYPSVLR